MTDAERATPASSPVLRPWNDAPPGRLMGRGHPAGDFLEAWAWDLLEERDGYLRIGAHLPDHLRNPRGQLFGGFTPTYVDLIALFTVRAGPGRSTDVTEQPRWLATTNLRVDYFEPITGPRFVMDSTREKQRGRTSFVTTRFIQDDQLAAFSVVTMRQMSADRPLGDA